MVRVSISTDLYTGPLFDPERLDHTCEDVFVRVPYFWGSLTSSPYFQHCVHTSARLFIKKESGPSRSRGHPVALSNVLVLGKAQEKHELKKLSAEPPAVIG